MTSSSPKQNVSRLRAHAEARRLTRREESSDFAELPLRRWLPIAAELLVRSFSFVPSSRHGLLGATRPGPCDAHGAGRARPRRDRLTESETSGARPVPAAGEEAARMMDLGTS